jgi:hypothetical protein
MDGRRVSLAERREDSAFGGRLPKVSLCLRGKM